MKVVEHRKSKIDMLNKYLPFISALAAIIASLVALYLGDWKDRIQAPKLRLHFDKNDKEIFKQKLAFERFTEILNIDGNKLPIFRPGLSLKIQVLNKGKLPAKAVYGRVDKIVFFKNGEEHKTRYYYPTTIKWSGEDNWHPVDITQNSHFFLDLIWVKNETIEEIASFNLQNYSDNKIYVDKDLFVESIKNDIKPIDDTYWNVWINTSYNRGIPNLNFFEGEMDIYYTVGADNCKPIKFKMKINWSKIKWDNPDATLYAENKFILDGV